MLLVEQVVHTDAHAVDLVGVGRADATAGGADLLLASEAFGDFVDRAVVRRNDVRGFAHEQARAIDAAAFEPIDLLEQHFGVHHNAIADDRRGARADDAGRLQVQRIRFVAHDHGVSCIVAAVEPGNVIHLGADQISGFAFAFVAPLGAQVQRIRFVAHDHGVSCIVAAVEPGNVIHLGADQISGFAFAFVAPLGADQYDSRHVCSSGSPYSRRGKVTPRPARLARGGGARGAKPRYLSARPADPSCSHASSSSGSPYSRRGKVTPRPARLARGGGARGAKPRYLSARPADPSCSHASTTRAAIESSASRPHERGSYIFLLPTSPSTLSTSS